MKSHKDTVPAPIIDEAIRWLIRLEMNEATEDQHTELEQWLQRNPLHRLAWSRVKDLHGGFTTLQSQPIAHALRTLDKQRQISRQGRRRALKTLSLAGMMLGSGWLTKEYTPWQRLLSDFTTVTGEQATLDLPDGSHLMLNTDSAVSTDLGGQLRTLTLRRGEMLLATGRDSGHEQPRPFRVETSAGRIQTLNSRFTVRLEDQRARVSILEGHVELLNRKGTHQRGQSGESIWLSANGISQAATGTIPADAWTSGVIAGKRIPLGELLDELSRYRTGVIDYTPRLADFPVSGVFQLHNTDDTLKFLANTQPIKVEFRTPFWVVVDLA
ncbi:FecR domain-containing protein [Marinobacterium iners]|uniref:FecR family protein n=1 Tax=Marinobacterium iners DSM 11526 TaxID=1122198 RepID=A0A1H4G7V3_9GAMM|nr:FecR family protein [Marinobacterium iners]SEB05634.1 FecR family protein [Marinobacterium iners DSM 11526]